MAPLAAGSIGPAMGGARAMGQEGVKFTFKVRKHGLSLSRGSQRHEQVGSV